MKKKKAVRAPEVNITQKFTAKVDWFGVDDEAEDRQKALPKVFLKAKQLWESDHKGNYNKVHALISEYVNARFLPSNVDNWEDVFTDLSGNGCPEYKSSKIQVTGIAFGDGPIPTCKAEASFDVNVKEELGRSELVEFFDKNGLTDAPIFYWDIPEVATGNSLEFTCATHEGMECVWASEGKVDESDSKESEIKESDSASSALIKAANAKIVKWHKTKTRGDQILELNETNFGIGLKFPEEIKFGLSLDGLSVACGVILPTSVGGDLSLNGLLDAKELVLPLKVNGYLFLNGLTSGANLKLPEHIGGDLCLNGVTKAEGLSLPKEMQGGLSLNILTDVKKLTLPSIINGDLNLNGVKSAIGLVLPSKIGGSLVLQSLVSASGIIMPTEVGRDLFLPDVVTLKGVTLPKFVGRGLILDGLSTIEGLTLPTYIGGWISLNGLNNPDKEKLRKIYPDMAKKIK